MTSSRLRKDRVHSLRDRDREIAGMGVQELTNVTVFCFTFMSLLSWVSHTLNQKCLVFGEENKYQT